MTATSTFIANLRRHLSPSNKELLDAIASDPMVIGILEKSEGNALQERRAHAKALAEVPAKHAKRIAEAGAQWARASVAERQAEQALADARAAARLASNAVNGADMLRSQEETFLREKLLTTAPTLVVAASRAAEAFSPAVWEPVDAYRIGVRRDSSSDPHTRAENEAADRLAHEANGKVAADYRAALAAIHTARQTLRDMMLEPLSEAESAERVTEVFAVLNEKLYHLKDSPAFAIDENLDVRVRTCHDRKIVTIKTADVAVAVQHEEKAA